MNDTVFALRDIGSEPPSGRGLIGATPLEQAWLDALVRRVVVSLGRDQVWFMVSILWAPGSKERSADDTCSTLQRLGLVRPTRARSVCVPSVLTPLGHSVREFLVSVARWMPPR